jgi:hypothetical protein
MSGYVRFSNISPDRALMVILIRHSTLTVKLVTSLNDSPHAIKPAVFISSKTSESYPVNFVFFTCMIFAAMLMAIS